MPAARVAARAATVRRGAAGERQREAGEAAGEAQAGTWCEEKRAEVAGALHMAGEGGGGGAEKKQRSRGWRKKTRTAL
jgi:hypothetical protein